MIAYDQTKMDELFSEIKLSENGEEQTILSDTRIPRVSLETELYLMLNAERWTLDADR